jgi:predicted neutral ceramidase superfamily lipid hydrolase
MANPNPERRQTPLWINRKWLNSQLSELSDRSTIAFSLKRILSSLVLVQVYVVLFVALYSLLIGNIDYVYPIKSGIVCAIASFFLLAIGDVWTEWKIRSGLFRLGISLYRLCGEVVSSLAMLSVAYPFLITNFPKISLTGLPIEIKSIGGIVILALFVVGLWKIADVWELRQWIKRTKLEFPPIPEGVEA